MNKAETGTYGELVAGRLLREKGYRIISANYRCRLGEIDIIAADKKHICFVEVKTREENSMFRASDAVDFAKQKKTVLTAQQFLSQHKTSLQPRFDVIEVYMKNDREIKVNHIENAYGGESV